MADSPLRMVETIGNRKIVTKSKKHKREWLGIGRPRNCRGPDAAIQRAEACRVASLSALNPERKSYDRSEQVAISIRTLEITGASQKTR